MTDAYCSQEFDPKLKAQLQNRKLERQKPKKQPVKRKNKPMSGAEKSFRAMINRCTYPSSGSYDRYGGKGITVCEEWQGRGGFKKFLTHIGERPDGYTLDRIDPLKGYEQGNVQWATKADQARNRSRLFHCYGVSKTLIEWCEIHKMSYGVVQTRVCKHGWAVERALRTPVQTRSKKSGEST